MSYPAKLSKKISFLAGRSKKVGIFVRIIDLLFAYEKTLLHPILALLPACIVLVYRLLLLRESLGGKD